VAASILTATYHIFSVAISTRTLAQITSTAVLSSSRQNVCSSALPTLALPPHSLLFRQFLGRNRPLRCQSQIPTALGSGSPAGNDPKHVNAANQSRNLECELSSFAGLLPQFRCLFG
jgi:hypothetical protein